MFIPTRILPNILAVSLNAPSQPLPEIWLKTSLCEVYWRIICEVFASHPTGSQEKVSVHIYIYIYIKFIFIQICSYQIIRFCGVFCGFVYHIYTGKLQNLHCINTFKVMFLFLCHVLHIFS